MFYYSFYLIKELYKSKTEALQKLKQKRFHLNPLMSYQLKYHTTQTHLAHKVLKKNDVKFYYDYILKFYYANVF